MAEIICKIDLREMVVRIGLNWLKLRSFGISNVDGCVLLPEK
jgi:hypothetical protein